MNIPKQINFKLGAVLTMAILTSNGIYMGSARGEATNDLPQPKNLIVDKSLGAPQIDQTVHAARLFYAFWDTGDSTFARAALAPSFLDRTLPKGRPQGIGGPLFASHLFRQAVPDLHCEVEQLIVVDDRVVAHLHFRGHFSGVMGQKKGADQPVDFIATDILRVQNGMITDNWHIEDNLTLMQQLGLVQL